MALFSNVQNRQEVVNKIAVSEVLLQDQRWMHLDELTEDFVEVFTTEQGSVRPYEFPDNVHFSMSYEMDLNKYVIERTVYTSLDWLGDVGGLQGILFDIGAMILMFIQGNGLNYLLLRTLFKEEGKRVVDSDEDRATLR